MRKKVYITGIGIISGIGFNQEETLDSLLNSRSGIGHIQYLDTKHSGKVLTSEVKATHKALMERASLNSRKVYSRTTLLGLLAAKEAYQQAGLTPSKEWKTGVISATSVGGIDKSEMFYEDYYKDQQAGNLRNMVCHDCGDSTEIIADTLQTKDYVSTISTACSSSANSIMFGSRLIQHGVLDQALVGGTDALTRYTLNGFNALRILDSDYCKPFDQERKGLNLGEGAAFIVLESERSVNNRKVTPLAELSGYGNANDAFHQTASSPEGLGAFEAMKIALETSGKKPDQINYVNAHGTATVNNDLSEGNAIKRLFRDYFPLFSSTKSFTGHTLAAAGAVEAVISVLSIQHQTLFPNLNFSNPIQELDIRPVRTITPGVKIKNILSNSFGFGGNCSSIIISSC